MTQQGGCSFAVGFPVGRGVKGVLTGLKVGLWGEGVGSGKTLGFGGKIGVVWKNQHRLRRIAYKPLLVKPAPLVP